MNQIRIVIGGIHGYIIQEPVRRKKVVCGLKIRKLYLGDDEGRKIAEKNVQLNGIGITGQQITTLGNDASVRLLNQMPVGLFVQGEIVFFSGKKALSFISEIVIIFIPAHTDNGVRVQIALFDQTAGIPLQVFRQLFYCKFPLDFHSVLQSAAAENGIFCYYTPGRIACHSYFFNKKLCFYSLDAEVDSVIIKEMAWRDAEGIFVRLSEKINREKRVHR